MTTSAKILKTMSLKIIHHLICQCENLNNTYERLSLLMFILHQEGSFSIAHFLRTCSLCFWNSHIQLIAFCSAQILHSSYTCRFLRLLICQRPIRRLQMRQICRNIINSFVYLICLENSQQSAHKVLLNNKYYYL